METTNQIDKEFEAKYARWLELAATNPKSQSIYPEESENPIVKEDEISQIIQLAKSLGGKGYEFDLIFEPRNSYKKILITREYYPGPFKILTSSILLKPLEWETYDNFDAIYSALAKCRVGIYCKFNPKNILIYKSDESFCLGFRCHKCDSFTSDDLEIITNTNDEQIPDIPKPHTINHSVFCSRCQNAGLTDKELTFKYDVQQTVCVRANIKSLSLDYSSGGSVSMVHNFGSIIKL